jgi:hypothetical protein
MQIEISKALFNARSVSGSVSVSVFIAIFSFVLSSTGCSGAVTRADGPTDNRAPADIGGANYNIGTYSCADSESGLEATFTFGESTGSLIAKGESVALNCTPARQASSELAAHFKNEYKAFADLCSGRSKKGNILVGSSNSMGIVQLTAFLLDPSGNQLAKSVLNCSTAKKANSGW